MSTKRCNKCKKLKSMLDFKNNKMKQCLECNRKQHMINTKKKEGWMETLVEYSGLRRIVEVLEIEMKLHPTDIGKARLDLYKSVLDMVDFDPERGDMKENMTEEEIDRWRRIRETIRLSGEVILKQLHSLDDRYILDRYLSYVPTPLHRDIEVRWDGLSFKDGVKWVY